MSEPDLDRNELALKQALKRAIKPEIASPELRARVQAALAAEGHADSNPSSLRLGLPPKPSRFRVPYLAVAAMLVLGIGIAYFTLFKGESPAPQWFADAMVSIHDQHSALPDHHLLTGVPQDDLDAIAKVLSAELGHPVLAKSPGPGWKFLGAGLCNIRKSPAAHLLFRRGDDTLSIFSVASSALYTSSDSPTQYAQVDQGHEIAGFVTDNAVHCIVCYSKTGDITLRQAVAIRNELRQSFADANIH